VNVREIKLVRGDNRGGCARRGCQTISTWKTGVPTLGGVFRYFPVCDQHAELFFVNMRKQYYEVKVYIDDQLMPIDHNPWRKDADSTKGQAPATDAPAP
jgi:hypothetical protein